MTEQPHSPGAIAVVGGGSAGHVVPALPVIDALLNRQWQIHFIGTRSGLEAVSYTHLTLPTKNEV